MSTLRKGEAIPALTLRRAEVSILGAAVTVRELMRAEWRAVQNARAAHLFTAEDGQSYYTVEGLELADAATLAFGAIDAETGEALWDTDAIVSWASRPALWADVRAAAQTILSLSEVGAEATKSGDPPADAGG